jgi:hypothetical protein
MYIVCGGEDVDSAPYCVDPEGNVAEVMPSPLEAPRKEELPPLKECVRMPAAWFHIDFGRA